LVLAPSQPLARLIVRRRSGDRTGPGWMRLVDGATTNLSIGRRACWRHCICLRFGSGEALRIWSLEDHIKGSACRCRNKPSGICARGFCMVSTMGNSGSATVRLGRRNRFSADAAPSFAVGLYPIAKLLPPTQCEDWHPCSPWRNRFLNSGSAGGQK